MFKRILQKFPVSRNNIIFDSVNSHGSKLCDKGTKRVFLDFANSYKLTSYKRESDVELISDSSVIQDEEAVQDASLIESVCIKKFQQFAMPFDFEYLYFVKGAPVELALKVAFDWKYKYLRSFGESISPQDLVIMHFTGATHDKIGYSLSLNSEKSFAPQFDWPKVPYPYMDDTLTDTSQFDFYEREKYARTKIEQFFSHYGNRIAAIIIEPVQYIGLRRISGSFWRYLKYMCDQYNTLLICDEVETGFGITGKVWAYENFGELAPDIVCFGKRTHVNGIMCHPKITEVDNIIKNQEQLPPKDNLATMMMATELIREIDGGNLISQHYTQCYMRDTSYTLANHQIVTGRRGTGLLQALDFPDKKTRDKIVQSAYDNKLLIAPSGENSVILRPFLDVSRDAIDQMFEILNPILKNYKD